MRGSTRALSAVGSSTPTSGSACARRVDFADVAGDSSGTLVVSTATGVTYELLLDDMRLRLMPPKKGTTTELVLSSTGFELESAPRRDGEWELLRQVVRLELDMPAVFLTSEQSGRAIKRITADVTAIAHLR